MSDTPTPITDAVSLRAARKTVMPSLIEYRTTDSRIVDAVRMLDSAADEIDRLMMENIKLREEKAELVRCIEHIIDFFKTRGHGHVVVKSLETLLAKHTKGTTT